jgi:periplasmic divalent cation tolerance protein
MSEIIKIAITFSDRETAEKIGRGIVEKRLAACAQIGGPIKSIYRWKGKMEETEEWVCTLKTRKDLYGVVEAEVKALHPYEVPQIIAIDIPHALPEYAEWVEEETGNFESRMSNW